MTKHSNALPPTILCITVIPAKLAPGGDPGAGIQKNPGWNLFGAWLLVIGAWGVTEFSSV